VQTAHKVEPLAWEKAKGRPKKKKKRKYHSREHKTLLVQPRSVERREKRTRLKRGLKEKGEREVKKGIKNPRE